MTPHFISYLIPMTREHLSHVVSLQLNWSLKTFLIVNTDPIIDSCTSVVVLLIKSYLTCWMQSSHLCVFNLSIFFHFLISFLFCILRILWSLIRYPIGALLAHTNKTLSPAFRIISADQGNYLYEGRRTISIVLFNLNSVRFWLLCSTSSHVNKKKLSGVELEIQKCWRKRLL